MAIRALKLPQDLVPLESMLVETFQYPENPEWGIQADEQEDIARELKTLRKLWPLFRVVQAMVPSLRDFFRGFVWEEDGQIGGVVITQRSGKTNLWSIAVVGVLPEFRRRGLARKLLTRTLDDIRSRGAQRVVLGVIEKNVPAYELYKSLGFEHYATLAEYHLHPTAAPNAATLPSSIQETLLARFDWKPQFELAKRISPEAVRRYEPMEEDRFKTPAPMRLLAPLMDRLRGLRQGRYLYWRDGVVVGKLLHRTSTSGKGTSSLSVRLDPNEPDIAPYMLSKAVRAVIEINPTLRIQCTIPTWMTPSTQSAEDLGFTVRVRYDMLGLIP